MMKLVFYERGMIVLKLLFPLIVYVWRNFALIRLITDRELLKQCICTSGREELLE
jgi:hypothetical protein